MNPLKHATESMTNVIRASMAGTLIVMALAALVGWLLGKDPTPLVGPMGIVAGGVLTGEASNVGKRWTFSADADTSTVKNTPSQPGEVL